MKELLREASHAGTWYSDSDSELRAQFDGWLLNVKGPIDPKAIPKIIISPHAGYRYSGQTAAYAMHQILRHPAPLRRIIILGPSHRAWLTPAIQMSRFQAYDTPLGSLSVDPVFDFPFIKANVDIAEHSLEMQIPFLKHVLDKRAEAGLDTEAVMIVPMLVGDSSQEEIDQVATMIYALLKNETNDAILLVSSDFCHWGKAFDYTPSLSSISENAPLHERIKELDKQAQEAIQADSDAFDKYLVQTKNTICGCNPIRIALEASNMRGLAGGSWSWLYYDQSGSISDPASSSSQVSYVAGAYTLQSALL